MRSGRVGWRQREGRTLDFGQTSHESQKFCSPCGSYGTASGLRFAELISTGRAQSKVSRYWPAYQAAREHVGL